MVTNLLAIALGIALDYAIKDPSKYVRIVLDILAWSF